MTAATDPGPARDSSTTTVTATDTTTARRRDAGPTTGPTVQRHRLDLLSLLTGLTFVVVAVASLTGSWLGDVAGWVWPSLLIGAGVVVLAAVVSGSRDADGDPTDVAGADGTGPDEADTPDPVLAAARAEAEAADPWGRTDAGAAASPDDPSAD